MRRRTGETWCGEFYDSRGACVGHVIRLASGRYVIRGVAPFSGKTIWQSGEFTGREFRLVRTLDVGYARVNCYTGKAV